MTSAKFERVLHPIFEEDELTLILAGGFLGFAAGLIQQGIEVCVTWIQLFLYILLVCFSSNFATRLAIFGNGWVNGGLDVESYSADVGS
jgi:hypothetical protein